MPGATIPTPPSAALATTVVEVTADSEDETTSQRGASGNPFAALPPPIRIADTITSQETEPPPDPTMGRDTERDFMLQNMGFF